MSVFQTYLQWMGGNGQALSCGTASATVSAAFPTGTSAIRVIATTNTWIEITSGASASANSSGFLPANTIEYLPAAASNTLSALSAASNGTLYIKPCCG